jgi:SAM-dependent methyltransferase
MLALKPATATNCILLPKRGYQKCPLCGEGHPVMMRGLIADMENDEMTICNDKGYSFCNCNNIFYTDWKNINLDKYDETYAAKYECKNWAIQARNEFEKMFPIFKENCEGMTTFLEIGCIHDNLLNVANDYGLKAGGIDITVRPSKYDLVFANIEEYEPEAPSEESFGIVWASHIIEHLKDPKKFLIKMSKIIGEKGVLYIATPDTFFIDFEHKNPLAWDWVVDEHYILWGMESLIDFAGEVGLKCVYSERNIDVYKKTDNRVFWKNDMKLVFKNG